MPLKPNKYSLIIFSFFLLFLALPIFSVLREIRIPFTGFLVIISAFSWWAPLAVLSSLGLNVFAPCLEECAAREPNPFGLIVTIILNLLFYYSISCLIGEAIEKRKNNESPRPLITN